MTLNSVVVTSGDSRLQSLAWLFAIANCGGIVAPLGSERREEARSWSNFFEVGWQVVSDRLVKVAEGKQPAVAGRLFNILRARQHPGLILATGGTTGTPKIVLHDLVSLLGAIIVKSATPRRTLPLMRFDHIGGLDMAWRALASQQILIAPPPEITPESVGAIIERHRVDVMAATPSFLNLLLFAGVRQTYDLSSLKVVPFGAEPMPFILLERLRKMFPDVDFVQRFGTSETGALPVRDHGSGLILNATRPGFAWKIVDRELWIQSPARALGYLSDPGQEWQADNWFNTGDLAETLPGGGVRVLGRRDERINVGGEKIFPGEVEDVLLAHPLVEDCRVTARPNSILGQVVSADVVWRGPERDPLAVKKLLHAHAVGALGAHKLPVVVQLVEFIDTTRNLKKSRVVNL